MAKPCSWCEKKPKRLIKGTDGKERRDHWCSAKCKKAAKNEDYKFAARSRPCNGDHGWF